ncbi:uncharacterized protein LOC6565229 [Drosophila grimshawi]|uniref:GH12121 n=1 Tax=Drosophila grimshawi TaxID=7222 RepID=B4JK40_DROGR|nr:uncharacterized protein LOC6565229 [Drosophila grimshawi]EDV99942.1 GH12121 [Drosophila grimshawi]
MALLQVQLQFYRLLHFSGCHEMKPSSHLAGLLVSWLSISCLALQTPDQQRLLVNEVEIVSKLSDALHLILMDICAAHNMSVFVSTRYREQLPLEQQHIVEQVLERVLSFDSNAALPIVMDTLLHSDMRLNIRLLVFFVQDAQQLATAALHNTRGDARYKFNNLIVLLTTTDDAQEQQAQMSQIFDFLLHRRYNVNALLLLVDPQLATLDAYTFWPYRSQQSCLSTQPVRVSLRNAQFNDLYPHKLHNLHGCPLSAVAWHVPPYMEVYPQSDEAIKEIAGFDAEILKVLASRLNFSLVLMRNEPPDLIGGETFWNGTMTGAYLMLSEHRANITIGFTACQPARSKYLASTQPYNQLEFVLVVHGAQSYSSYEIMLMPFNTNVWLLLVAMVGLRLLCRLRGWQLISPLHIGWLYSLFLFRICYESSVFMFVQNRPMRPLPESLEQALELDYSLVVPHRTYHVVQHMPSLLSRTTILPGKPVNMFDQLLAMPADRQRRTAIISTQHYFRYYLATTATGERLDDPHLVQVKEKFRNSMVCMHFPPSFYMTGVFNQMLFNMRCSGITQHISDRTKWSRLNPMHSSTSQTNVLDHDKSMSFIYTAFFCLLLVEALTIVVFALELLSQRWPRGWLSSIFRQL